MEGKNKKIRGKIVKERHNLVNTFHAINILQSHLEFSIGNDNSPGGRKLSVRLHCSICTGLKIYLWIGLSENP